MRVWGFVLLVLVLAGCAGETPEPRVAPDIATAPILRPPSSVPLECVPYARYVSGIEIYGDAWTWWDHASGRFARGSDPRLLSVLVLSRSDRLRRGHVAVVTGIVGPREILVSHANWGWDRSTRHRIAEDMPVIDVSPDNSWRTVRFLHEPSDTFGRVYPAYGFIYRDSQVASGG